MSFWGPLWRPWASQGRLCAAVGPTVRSRIAHVRTDTLFHENGLPRAPPKKVGGRGAAGSGPLLKQHSGVPGEVFAWGKHHSSETGYLQALANVTKVTFAFLKREVNTKVRTNLYRGMHWNSVARHAVGLCNVIAQARRIYRLPPLPPTSQNRCLDDWMLRRLKTGAAAPKGRW